MSAPPDSTAKPRHLDAEYGAQFADESVAAAYVHRPPYPDAVFATLASLIPAGPRRVLELGCGSGDLTLGLAPHVDTIDAIEPSEPMLARARIRGSGSSNVRWLATAAEAFAPTEVYGLVVAAESLHWMDWAQVFPMITRALAGRGVLAIVTERRFDGFPWAPQLQELIAAYSTNRDYRAYDLIDELSGRGLFHERGSRICAQPFAQSGDDYIESFHSRNGFSRQRMAPEHARAFDAALRDLVLAHSPSGVVIGTITARVVWGEPTSRA